MKGRPTIMTDEKPTPQQLRLRADELIADLHTRESSTLVVATVASSASLVLLGIYPSATSNLPIALLENWAGFFFPIFGLFYRDLTVFTIDYANSKELHELTGHSTPYPGWVRAATHVRRWVLRSFLAVPSAFWWLRISNYACTIFVPLSIVGLASALLGALQWGESRD